MISDSMKNVIFVVLVVLFSPQKVFSKNYPVEALYTYRRENRDPFLKLIRNTKKTLLISAYKIDDKEFVEEILSAKKRGVDVKIILEGKAFKHSKTASNNESLLKKLHSNSIEFFERSTFVSQNHAKYLISDREAALITTGNFDTESFDGDQFYSGNIDFTALVKNRKILEDLEDVFFSDIRQKKLIPKNRDLLWGPFDQRKRFKNLINSAQKEIFIYQQSFTDREIYNLLVTKIKEGIKIYIIMMPFPFSKDYDDSFVFQKKLRDLGARVGYLRNGIYVHAKVVLIDPLYKTGRAYVGSCNFYKPSIDQNRELGIILKNPDNLKKLHSSFKKHFLNTRKEHPVEETNH